MNTLADYLFGDILQNPQITAVAFIDLDHYAPMRARFANRSTKTMSSQPHLSCIWSNPVDWDALTSSMVPAEPGYYAFTDHNGPLSPSGGNINVLYVGIATQSLRSRISKYKTGDTASIAGLHKGGFLMFLSRASAHFHDGKLTHSVQRTPIEFTIKSAGQPPQHGTLEPQKFYLRWCVDYRAAIEALLIQQLNPKFNTMFIGD